ncbi:MAG: hypothetical protein ACD_2C00240G0002 [uncultured bacterium (gcode 4)]|uniref:Uncharacterized protein n=1 Tax=uncultured bacterium (gcode 4) TaxID=1234023 RepID=K2G422_9BACT|nr:MAG: hypothetical protein ACD_2C00240G0002 [uncultured bacterium (gcode 4)]
MSDTIETPMIEIWKSELFIRMAEVWPNSSELTLKIRDIIDSVLKKEKEAWVYVRNISLDMDTYHEMFIWDRPAASLLITKWESFDWIMGKAEEIFKNGDIEILFVPFADWKETVVVRRDMTSNQIWRKLAYGYFSEMAGN